MLPAARWTRLTGTDFGCTFVDNVNQPARRPQRRNLLALSLLLIVTLVVVGGWWANAPKRTAERFIALMSRGDFESAADMLVDRQAIRTDGNGLHIRVADGTTVTIAADELPLVVMKSQGRTSRTGFGDVLLGRFHFDLTSSGPALPQEQENAIEIHGIAERNRIVLVEIEQ
jgi:hypothetical protein